MIYFIIYVLFVILFLRVWKGIGMMNRKYDEIFKRELERRDDDRRH